MRVDHLNNLRALEAVLRTGGLRPAAKELGVSPAAVGQQIRNLEDYLECSLLDRHPTGSNPVPRANQVAKDLTKHMYGLADVVRRLRPPKEANRVALSVLPSLAESWFPRHIATLFSQFPGLDLRLDASSKVANLRDGEYDFAVRYMRDPLKEAHSELLFSDYCAPVCTPGFAERYGLETGSASLEKVPMAEIDLDALPSPRTVPGLVDWCDAYGVTSPNINAGQVQLTYTSGRKLASSGLAIFLAGLHDVIDELESGEIVLPFGRERVLLNSNKFWLVWRHDSRLSLVQKKFSRWMLDRAADDRRRIEQFLSP